jgi:ATP-dependent DNA ligase
VGFASVVPDEWQGINISRLFNELAKPVVTPAPLPFYVFPTPESFVTASKIHMPRSAREKPLKDVARFIQPMKPTMVSRLPDDRSKWLLEPKLDGYRAVAVKSSGHSNLYSMDAKVYNSEFPEIHEAITKLMVKDVVLDGEIVAVEPNGKPNFNALQNRRSTKLPIYYIVFDCLHYKGRDLLDKPIEERKKYLAQIAVDFIAPLQPVFEFGPDLDLETAISVVQKAQIEGLVAKLKGSRYEGGESDLWLKQRFNQEGKFVIGGYIPGSKGIGELLIGEYREDKLHFIKRLNAGLNQFNRPEVFKAVQDLKTKEMPFANLPERRGPHSVTEEVMKECVWLKPEQKAEVEFVERTPGGRLRHASFRRLLPR